ncbi:MAG TPA: Mrp/NBP35 family ATP-binding protein [Anaerolineaceae bacterium]|jgi:Mrp family chromosome partitioning ATPase|nr:Mrp/NBP35 family ATP-binding protein [Anaerolineaceae bacterium]NMD30968.1 Mrp/NBP35 family ATP-binding protein [Chloroflexota bacterium]HNZ01577.1 Mrp/NBP35 family ATP-binding protein [Anaerolineaceae bacterium]HOD44091.1 Mrp/NBP35 family ATP-binding protein [Anaerolineaceae bacterium]HOH21002.1 Mrp/NBP35 family ATP-binding protein [Anaerolineaceae bacterium]
MITDQEVMAALSQVMDPELGRNLVELNMIRNLHVRDGKVTFTIALTIPNCPMRDQIRANAQAAVEALPGVSQVTVTLGAMTEEERRAVLGTAQPSLPKLNPFNKIGQTIAVLSGKGGVGKSSVTALLAVALAKAGKKVGVLDADITGPSIPKLFGLPPGGVRGSEQGILPIITPLGIRIISTNLLVPEEDTAVVWRGPMITGAIKQFWSDVLWGKLDTMLVDLPPGTSDATLTVLQSLPLDGVLLVTTPQQLASLVVRKAVRMIQSLNVPILGIVENMSYYPCPDTGKPHYIFGPSHADEIAEKSGAPVWARLPIDPRVAELADAGAIEQADVSTFAEIVGRLNQPK